MKSIISFCVGAILSAAAFAASERFDAIVDEHGYPIEDPRYDEIRTWHASQQEGLALYRREAFEAAYPVLAEPARHGFKEAQHAISLMHIKGQGVEKNVLVGVALLGLAAESGDRKLVREYKKSVKALPERFRDLVRAQTEYYIERYGMKAQGVSCNQVKQAGSNLKQLKCVKQPGSYQNWAWNP